MTFPGGGGGGGGAAPIPAAFGAVGVSVLGGKTKLLVRSGAAGSYGLNGVSLAPPRSARARPTVLARACAAPEFRSW